MERKFHLWNFRSWERKFSGTKVPVTWVGYRYQQTCKGLRSTINILYIGSPAKNRPTSSFLVICKRAGLMSKHADVTLTRGHEVSSLLSLLNVVFSAHCRRMTNAGRFFSLKCVFCSKTHSCIMSLVYIVMATNCRPVATGKRRLVVWCRMCVKCVCWSKTHYCIVACIFRIAGLHFTTLSAVLSLR